jgi:hypothetical protein
MDCTAQLTDFMPAYNVVRHPCECRRFAVRFAAGSSASSACSPSCSAGTHPNQADAIPGPRKR